jgi:hypothetical protein
MAIKKSELYSSLGQSCDELRGGTPLPQIIAEVEILAARVDEHLKKMRAGWKSSAGTSRRRWG